MKLTFDDKEHARYARMRGMVAEFRALASEVKIANEHLPALTQSEQALREAIPQFAPSRLLAFGPDIREALQQHRDAAFLFDAVRSSERLVASRLSKLKAELEREFKELQTALRWRVKESFPAPGRRAEKLNTNSGIISPACSEAINRVVTIEGETIADRAEALTELAKELGAELEVTS